MPKLSKHRIIWKRNGQDHDDLILCLPNIITDDINFQLMFGVIPDPREDQIKLNKHHENFRIDHKKYKVNELKEIYR